MLHIRGIVPTTELASEQTPGFQQKVVLVRWVAPTMDAIELDLANHETTKVPIAFSSQFMTRVRSHLSHLQDVEL
jgi:hypothetical protein